MQNQQLKGVNSIQHNSETWIAYSNSSKYTVYKNTEGTYYNTVD